MSQIQVADQTNILLMKCRSFLHTLSYSSIFLCHSYLETQLDKTHRTEPEIKARK